MRNANKIAIAGQLDPKVAQWLAIHSPSTQEAYGRDLREFCRWGALGPSELQNRSSGALRASLTKWREHLANSIEQFLFPESMPAQKRHHLGIFIDLLNLIGFFIHGDSKPGVDKDTLLLAPWVLAAELY